MTESSFRNVCKNYEEFRNNIFVKFDFFLIAERNFDTTLGKFHRNY